MLQAGLYVITDSGLLRGLSMEAAVTQAIRGGARAIQYREKRLSGSAAEQTAALLVTLCRRHAVPLIINDDVELAARTGADGVHLGRSDSPVRAARERLGADAIIGVSCYNSMERASDAIADGADYLAFGRFFPSRSKPDAVPADTALLTRARQAFDIPLVAIGGITPDNGADLLRAGADLLAAIDGVFGQADIEVAARSYTELFERENL